jgi:hypothetical protein
MEIPQAHQPSTATAWTFFQIAWTDSESRPRPPDVRIVHENVEPALFGDDLANRGADGLFRGQVQFNRTQVHRAILRELFHVRGLRRIASGGVPHRGVDGVARLGEGVGGQAAKAVDAPVMTIIFLDMVVSFPLVSVSLIQAMPPLARSVWPSIQPPSGPTRNDTVAAISSGVPRRSIGGILAR